MSGTTSDQDGMPSTAGTTTSSGGGGGGESSSYFMDHEAGLFRRRSAFKVKDDESSRTSTSGAKKNWGKVRRAVLTRAALSDLLDVTRQQKSSADEKEEAGTGGGTKPRRPTVHPRNMGSSCTVVAFINRGSGGGMGGKIYDDLVEILGKQHVFDLSNCHKGNMPEDILKEFALDPLVRILACGGDGTMGWIESSIDKVWQNILGEDVSVQATQYATHLPLAIMPLGTGNDLSRSFGWGKTYSENLSKPKHIQSIAKAAPATLDRWRCVVIPSSEISDEARAWVPKMLGSSSVTSSTTTSGGLLADMFEAQSERAVSVTPPTMDEGQQPQEEEMQIFDGVFCNYMSIGFDAQVAFKFHKTREEHPERFTSPLKNKYIYIKKSKVAFSSPTLADKIKVLVADSSDKNGKLRNLPVPKNCRAVVLMNIQSYAGGNQLARAGKQDDGLIEILFLTGVVQMATAAATFLKCKVAAQTNRVCIRTSQSLHCQVDGEPWLQSEAFFQISHYSQNAFLRRKTSNNPFSCASGDDTAVS